MFGKSKYDITLKVLMLGESGVGKTSVLTRFAEDKFSPAFLTTIGVDFKMKIIDLRDKKVRLQVWDTAGQERYRTITPAYYKNVMGVLIMFSIIDRSSFQNITFWLKNLEEYCSENIIKILLGNKCDLNDKREVSYEEGKELADKYKMEFFETSAKDKVNIFEVFEKMGNKILTGNPKLLEQLDSSGSKKQKLSQNRQSGKTSECAC